MVARNMGLVFQMFMDFSFVPQNLRRIITEFDWIKKKERVGTLPSVFIFPSPFQLVMVPSPQLEIKLRL